MNRRQTPLLRRLVIGVGLAVVTVAALLMSFTTLHAVAVMCGYSDDMAKLFPVALDAGAAMATFSWLAGDIPARARQFARRMAITLLATSVALNALGHGLVAAGAEPHWLVVVLVSALAPALLGACAHLVGLQNQAGAAPGERLATTPGEALATPGETITTPPGGTLATAPGEAGDATPATPGDLQVHQVANLAGEAPGDDPGEAGDHLATDPGDAPGDQAGEPGDEAGDAPTWRLAIVPPPPGDDPGDEAGEEAGDADLVARARAIVAAGGGRGTLAKELDLTPHQARQLLAKVKPATADEVTR